jgi:hypothetical protein
LIIESEPNKITRVQLIIPLYDTQRLTRP